jgi:hypothetical protein
MTIGETLLTEAHQETLLTAILISFLPVIALAAAIALLAVRTYRRRATKAQVGLAPRPYVARDELDYLTQLAGMERIERVMDYLGQMDAPGSPAECETAPPLQTQSSTPALAVAYNHRIGGGQAPIVGPT